MERLESESITIFWNRLRLMEPELVLQSSLVFLELESNEMRGIETDFFDKSDSFHL